MFVPPTTIAVLNDSRDLLKALTCKTKAETHHDETEPMNSSIHFIIMNIKTVNIIAQ